MADPASSQEATIHRLAKGSYDDARVEAHRSRWDSRVAPEVVERHRAEGDRARAVLDPDLRVQGLHQVVRARPRRTCRAGSTVLMSPRPRSRSSGGGRVERRGPGRRTLSSRRRVAWRSPSGTASRGPATGMHRASRRGRLSRFPGVGAASAAGARRRPRLPAGRPALRAVGRRPTPMPTAAVPRPAPVRTSSSASFQPLPGHRRRKPAGAVSIARTMASMPILQVRLQVVPGHGVTDVTALQTRRASYPSPRGGVRQGPCLSRGAGSTDGAHRRAKR